jgi:hypothetical protein
MRRTAWRFAARSLNDTLNLYMAAVEANSAIDFK